MYKKKKKKKDADLGVKDSFKYLQGKEVPNAIHVYAKNKMKIASQYSNCNGSIFSFSWETHFLLSAKK